MDFKEVVAPGQLGGLGVRQLAARVWAECGEDEVLDRAAALSFYFLFSLFPALLFLSALLGFLPIRGMLDAFLDNLARVLPPDAARLIRSTLEQVVQGSSVSLLSFGALASIWAASTGMLSVITALNVAYGVSEQRAWWAQRLLAIALTLGFSVLLLAALTLLVFGPSLGGALASRLGYGNLYAWLWRVLDVPLSVCFVLAAIALVYYFAPAAEQRAPWVLPGAVLATGLWLLASFGLRLYVHAFGNFSTAYGSLGAVILLMLWLYLTGLVLLVGAEVNAEIEDAAAHRGDRCAKASGEHVPGERDRHPAARRAPARTGAA